MRPVFFTILFLIVHSLFGQNAIVTNYETRIELKADKN